SKALSTPVGVLSAFENQSPESSSKSTAWSKDFSHYLMAAAALSRNVFSFFHQLTYIGPLRARPARRYELSSEGKSSVGVQGENTASLLRRSSSKHKREIDGWVKRFGFGDSVRLKNLDDDLVTLDFVQDNGNILNIADLGFGASQVLPLLVQCVAAERGTITIAEQPEVHLNPRLQASLADLFVSLADRGQKMLLETHSEHMLLRMRRLVAEGKISSSDVAVYFVESIDGVSTVRKIEVMEDGHIDHEDWPKGFFGDTLKESMDLAAAQVARAKRGESSK
ncbi:MAG: DUF3696 domain-containing protein, partial [Pseudomonadota bacterium]